ncbi:hypothetical protein Dimus_030746, partial [Dionaea muscipula]
KMLQASIIVTCYGPRCYRLPSFCYLGSVYGCSGYLCAKLLVLWDSWVLMGAFSWFGFFMVEVGCAEGYLDSLGCKLGE